MRLDSWTIRSSSLLTQGTGSGPGTESRCGGAKAVNRDYSLCVRDGLPLDIRDRIGAAATERYHAVLDVAGTRARRAAGRRARVRKLELALDGCRAVLPGRSRQRDADQRGDGDGAIESHWPLHYRKFMSFG
jgi:hypothetical protein